MLLPDLLEKAPKCRSYERGAQVLICLAPTQSLQLAKHKRPIASTLTKGWKVATYCTSKNFTKNLFLNKVCERVCSRQRRRSSSNQRMGRWSLPLEVFIPSILLLLLECPISVAGTPRGYWQRKRLSISPVTVTLLHFYFQDAVSGWNSTAPLQTAGVPGAAESPTGFGVPMTLDYPLTEGPQRTSKVIGRAHGTNGAAEQTEVGQRTALTYSFTDGEFTGSTLRLLERNSTFQRGGEMAVVGGTGAFRFARGYAFAKTRWSGPAGDAVVEYNVIVVH